MIVYQYNHATLWTDQPIKTKTKIVVLYKIYSLLFSYKLIDWHWYPSN